MYRRRRGEGRGERGEGIPSTTNTNVLQQTQVLDLMGGQCIVEVIGTFVAIGLDAPDVFLCHQT